MLENPRIMFSSFYPSLNRLEKRGFITSRFGDEPFPRRKYYSITGSGSSYLTSLSVGGGFGGFIVV